MSRIDKVDVEIINLLMEDGRISSTEIARRIGGITERAVRYRINRLVQKRLIQVTAVVNAYKLGYVVNADVFLEVESDRIQEVAQQMTCYEWVSYVAYSTGESNLSVQIFAHDTAEIYHYVTEVIGKTPGVRKTTALILPQVLKDTYQWRIPASLYIDNSR
jgi:Lrp/AsnC family transcriptional regulator for asnA, asnC and gidA